MEGRSNDMKRGNFSALWRGYMRPMHVESYFFPSYCLGSIHDVVLVILTLRTRAH